MLSELETVGPGRRVVVELQLTLRLPADTDAPTVRVPAVTTTFAPAPAPMPVAAGTAPVKALSGNTFTRHPKAWGIGAAVFAILVFAGIAGGGDKQPSASPTAADETTTAALPTTTEVPPTTTTPPPPTTTTEVGNGPAYVKGPVQVIGSDIYGLDSNNDGVACE